MRTRGPLPVLLLGLIAAPSLYLPRLSTLQHCCASRCSCSGCQFLQFFRIREKVFFRGKATKWQETTEEEKKLPPSSAWWEREGESCERIAAFLCVCIYIFIWVCVRVCVYARLCGQIQHQSTPRLAGWLASEGSSLFTATTPVMRCSEQRGRTTGILMATVRREDMCWGEKTTTHRQKKDLGVVWKRRLVLQRTLSGPLKKAPVCRRPLLRSRVLFIYLFIYFLFHPPKLKADKDPRRCPHFWAPLSAVGSALRSSCSASSSLASPALVSSLSKPLVCERSS